MTYIGLVGAILAIFAFEKITRDGVYEILSPWDQEWWNWKGIILLAVILPTPVFLFKWKEIEEYLEKDED